MSEKIWIGGIYLKEEGGYQIILKSLTHYKKRLQTIHSSPELKEAAAMFAPVLQSQAKKRIPMIENAIEKIKIFLLDSTKSELLKENVEILEKALECRKSDIEKAENTSDEYFVKLLGNFQESKKDVEQINNALKKIKEYLE
jgi:thymidylate synthase